MGGLVQIWEYQADLSTSKDFSSVFKLVFNLQFKHFNK